MKVCVIGAGAAGLVTIREARRRGCDVTAYEAGSHVGGIWVYTDEVEDDPLGQHPTRPLHTSLYHSLTTNLPRDLMAYSDFTFDSRGGGEDNWHRFPSHTQVLTYLERFAAHYHLPEHIHLDTPVESVRSVGGGWQVQADGTTNQFDAVIVCSGHYSKPRIPALPGLEHFNGTRSHSHNYRRPGTFKDQRVLIWGTSASGFDISQELATVASHVYVSGNVFAEAPGPVPMSHNLTGLPSITGFDQDGSARLGDTRIEVDHLMYCTGYEYAYPFLSDDLVEVDDNYVTGLYRDIASIRHPTLGFIGLPFLIVPFPMFEMQARWFAGHLAGDFKLPAADAMTAARKAREQSLADQGVLQRHYHRLGPAQEDYYNLLAVDLGDPPLPDWFMQTWDDVGKARETHAANYKDAKLPVRGPTVC